MQTVVCFGDSITRGQVSASYVEVLADRPTLQHYRFINRGVNSDLTINLLRRMKRVAALQPDVITILIGTNDIISTIRPFSALFFALIKGMTHRPGIPESTANLTRLVVYLKEHTRADIALASIPPLGEAMQSAPMALVRVYNAAVRRICATHQVAYVPVFERMAAYLHANGRRPVRVYHGSAFMTIEFALRWLFTAEDFHNFSARKGFTLLTDAVHLNRVGARLVAEEIEKYLLAREQGLLRRDSVRWIPVTAGRNQGYNE